MNLELGVGGVGVVGGPLDFSLNLVLFYLNLDFGLWSRA